MKKTITIEYEKSDYELLSKAKSLPEIPCGSCSNAASCCGCPKGSEYDKAWRPYEEAGILDIAKDLWLLDRLEKKRASLDAEISEVYSRIPSQFLDH